MSYEAVPSAQVPDWIREKKRRFAWAPARRLLAAIRSYQYWRNRFGPIGRVLSKTAVIRHRFWSIVCACDIPICTPLGGGLMLPHPTGIVIHSKAKIGPNCMIFQGVTIGQGGPIEGVPTIGGHVDIGSGAKILGGVTIGDHAKIGANAVVLRDVPAGATAVGIPARVILPEIEVLTPSTLKPGFLRYGDAVVCAPTHPGPRPRSGAA